MPTATWSPFGYNRDGKKRHEQVVIGLLCNAQGCSLGVEVFSALTHPEIIKLLDRKVIQAELFDEKNTVEVLDPEDPAKRYCLCRNPETANRETKTRRRLLDCTQLGLNKIVANKAKQKHEQIGARVGKLLVRYKMGKFVTWSVTAGKLRWTFDEAAIAAEQAFASAIKLNHRKIPHFWDS